MPNKDAESDGMHTFGLTGGIGSGKSAAAHYFAELGVPILDADEIARVVVEPGSAALASIAQTFGAEFILANGTLDRRRLRERIFSDSLAREWLETLLHPLIREVVREALQTPCSAPYRLLMAPLLLETGMDQLVEGVIVVDLPEALQLQRALARDQCSEATLRQIMQAQMSRTARLARANFCLDNSQSPTELQDAVKHLHTQLLALVEKNRT